MTSLEGLNYYVQSSEFTTLLDKLHIDPKIYLGLAILGFVTFLAHGRDA